MNQKILIVDDDREILALYERQLRDRFRVLTALGPEQGLEAVVKEGPFAVIVSDLRMPEMDGIQLLSRAREITPDSVRIILTGHADMEAAIAAVNEGNVFQFLTKPCPAEALCRALELGIQQYRLIMAERELTEKTLRGSVKVLTDLLAMINPEAFGRSARIARYIPDMAEVLGVPDIWRLETAAMLSQIGCVILPEQILRKIYRGQTLDDEESRLFEKHPSTAAELLAQIPRLDEIAEMVAYQEKHFDGNGIPADPVSGTEIPLGARILKVLLDFDVLDAAGLSRKDAIAQMEGLEGWYDPSVLEALKLVTGVEKKYLIRTATIEELATDMILAEDVRASGGQLLLARGQEVSAAMIQRLKNFARTAGVAEPIRVIVPLAKRDQEGGA